MKKLLLLLLLLPTSLSAQTARADRFTFNTGPCTMRSGSGTPSSGLGVLCDTYIDTATGILWLKQSGGWVSTGLTGSGTAGTLPKWATSTSLGDSSVDEYSSPAILRMQPAGDIELNPGGNDILPTTGYDLNLGMLTRKYLTLHAAELWVETLVAHNTMATMGGRILVGPTTTFVQDVGAADTTIHVKHNQMASGDRTYSEANGAVEFFAITSASSIHDLHYDYTVTRNLDGTGANAWTAGDALFNTGQTGNGFIDLYSTRGVNAGTEIGPTIVGNVRTSSTYNAWSPRWAIGNLDGLYGYSGSTYGAAFGVPSGARVQIDSTNGIRIWGGDNDEKVSIDTSGNATFDGNVTIGSGRNLIRNSECRVGSDDWDVEGNTGLTTVLTGPSFNPYRLLDQSNTCYISVTGTPAAATTNAARLTGQTFPVVPGLRYEMSAYLGNHGATFGRVMILWYNASNTLLSTSDGNQCGPSVLGGLDLDDWCRSGIIGTAPGTAQYAVAYIQTQYAGGVLNPYLFFVRTYFGEARTAQEDLTEWGAAGITEIIGGLIKTDAINARTIAADSITTSELAANSVTAAKIVAGTITADKLSVSSLSAITADLGTVNAGTMTGVSATFGGTVALNGSGLTLTSGSGANNQIKWSGGGPTIHGLTDNSLWVTSTDIFLAGGGGGQVNVSGAPFTVSSSLQSAGNIRFTTLAGLGGTRFVCHDNDGDLYSSGSTCDGSAPVALQIEALEREVAELRRALAAFVPIQ